MLSGLLVFFYLSCKLSNRIASVAAVAAPMTDTLINYICSPVRQLSVLHIQGTNDPILPVYGNEWFLPLRGPTDYWADFNGCNLIPDSTQLEDIDLDDSSTVTLFNYSGCDQENEVKLYRINGGGHTWPGGWTNPAWDLGTLNNDINASAEIWNFFKRNPHPNPWVEIPDTNFLSALINKGVDTNGDSKISYAEAEVVTELIISSSGIISLEGIQAFTHLESDEQGSDESGATGGANTVEFVQVGVGLTERFRHNGDDVGHVRAAGNFRNHTTVRAVRFNLTGWWKKILVIYRAGILRSEI
jgi:hypothetical protein